MTEELSPASLPLVYSRVGENYINCMHGYVSEQDICFQRDSISPLSADRSLAMRIKRFGIEMPKVEFEVRTVDGKRLIENGVVEDFTTGDDVYDFTIHVKDLIDDNTEYSLTLKLTLKGDKEVYYYTRIIKADNYHFEEKLDFAMSFSEKTFDKEKVKDLSKYMETNQSEDNSSLGNVNIHSSLSQLSYGELEVKQCSDPIFTIRELAEQTASIDNNYLVLVRENNYTEYYSVKEYYRLRYTVDRIYLLDFERKMNRIIDPSEEGLLEDSKLNIGIMSHDTDIIESDGGVAFAFENGGRLFSYMTAGNKFAELFSFYDKDSMDDRTLYSAHEIKPLLVDETGNVTFVVYGYMNRGGHEGEVGIEVCYYSSRSNTVEEMVFIPYTESFHVLAAKMRPLSYLSKSNVYYFILDGSIYGINIDTRNCEILADSLDEGEYCISDDQSLIIWNEGNSLILMNLNTKKQQEIGGNADECYKPIGFMGEDVIYGIANKEDIITDSTGITTFGMKSLVIQSENGTILKEYHADGVYITDALISGNQILLKRAVKSKDGKSYVATSDDQILSNLEEKKSINVLEKVIEGSRKAVQRISIKKSISSEIFKILNPKQVLYEGDRRLILPDDNVKDKYYAYAKNGIICISDKPGVAINSANENYGVVINQNGEYVWIRGNRKSRNQIMAITAHENSPERSSEAVCLDTILEYEGIIRDSQYLLDNGKTVLGILEENIENADILDLSDCDVETILYYVNRDIPVLAITDDESMLIIGFNESQIVLMNPDEEGLYKKNIVDMNDYFTENDTLFLTYLRE